MRFGNRHGFTLIELSIVLVIIGLLVGGVLVGQELIALAMIRAQISQIDKYTTSVFAFRNKYNCLPGDCANAVQLGLGQSGGPGASGDGDSRIGGTTDCFFISGNDQQNNYPTTFETFNFWYHLVQARMVEGSYAGYTGQLSLADAGVPQATMPAGKFSNTIIIPTVFACPGTMGAPGIGNGFWFVGLPLLGTEKAVPSLTSMSMDTKIDDGLPNSGMMVGDSGDVRPKPCQIGQWCGANSDSCNTSNLADNQYNTLSTGMCILDFMNRF
jgi:prepilin-type N-terminal cleavage/methylation domain-containing protein